MIVHESGTKIGAALQQFFPDAAVTVREMDYKNVLVVGWAVGEKCYGVHTPFGVDYRQRDYRHWLHKFAEIIREKIK